MVFVSHDQSSEVVQPSKEAFDLPSATIAPKGTSVLRLPGAPCPTDIGRDQLNATLSHEPLVQFVAVVGLVPDQSSGLLIQEAGVERGLNQGHFVG